MAAPPIPENHHLALGRFLSEWSEAERAADLLLCELLFAGTTNPPAQMTGGLSTRSKVELANNALSDPFLQHHKDARFKKFFDTFSKANLRRNNIVHANWHYMDGRFYRVSSSLTVWKLLDLLQARKSDPAWFASRAFDIHSMNTQTGRARRIAQAGFTIWSDCARQRLTLHRQQLGHAWPHAEGHLYPSDGPGQPQVQPEAPKPRP